MKVTKEAVVDSAPGNILPAESAGFTDTAGLQKRIPMSRRAFYEWRRKGIIPSVQIGSKILYHWPSVEAALLRHQNGGAS
jgi:hypothetical protein